MLKSRKLALITALVLVLVLSFSFFSETLGKTTSHQTLHALPPVATTATNTLDRGWINSSVGVAEHLPPVIIGADYAKDIAPLGPSVSLGTQETSMRVNSDTFLAESFTTIENSTFNTAFFYFSVPKDSGPNVTLVVYANGKIIGEANRDLAFGAQVPSNINSANVIEEQVNFSFNETSIQSGEVITFGFQTNGPVFINPVGEIPGSSSINSNMTSVPPNWTGAPITGTTAPVFLAVGELLP